MKQGELNYLAQRVHEINVGNGFYDHEVPFSQTIVLIHSELSEAIEADRKGRLTDEDYIKDFRVYPSVVNDKLVQDQKFKRDFEANIKDTVEDEIADAIIRLVDFCAYRGIDIDKHVEAKLRYNSMREYKHGKQYQIEPLTILKIKNT